MYGSDKEKSIQNNSFSSKQLVEYFEKYLVAYLPLWCQATMPYDVKGKGNAPIESFFRTVKHQYHTGNNHYAPDFYLEHYEIMGLTNTAVVDAIENPKGKVKRDKEESEIAEEKFKKTTQQTKRKRKYIRKIFNVFKGTPRKFFYTLSP